MSPDVPSAQQLYESILDRSPLPLTGFEKAFSDIALHRAKKIHNYLLDRADRLEESCDLCYEKKARKSQTRYVYETPWDDQETAKRHIRAIITRAKSCLSVGAAAHNSSRKRHTLHLVFTLYLITASIFQQQPKRFMLRATEIGTNQSSKSGIIAAGIEAMTRSLKRRSTI